MVSTLQTQKAVQTFKAPNMPSALEEIQRTLGPEAMIVSVRQVPSGSAWQVWKKAGVEVVAMAATKTGAAGKSAEAKAADMKAAILAIAAAREAIATTAPAARTEPAPVSAPTVKPFKAPVIRPAAEPAARPQAAAATAVNATPAATTTVANTTTATTAATSATPAAPSALEQACARLAEQGLRPALLRKVAEATARTLTTVALTDQTRVTWHLQQQLEAVLLTEAESAFSKHRVVCLIGTTGAGKTTMTARLAARLTQLRGRSVAWICADTMRAGAIAQARAYAETLKLPLRVVYTPGELAQAVAAESEADLVLVDMPGCNPRRENAVVELGAYLSALPERSTYWVAAATAKEADLADTLAAFHPFRLTGLMVTKLDETATFGNVYNLAWQSRLPLAFFTAGPRVLDELVPAEAEQLAAALLEGSFRS